METRDPAQQLRARLAQRLDGTETRTNLSPAQRRLWTLRRLNPAIPTHVAGAAVLDSRPAADQVRTLLTALVGTQDILTARFLDVAGRALRVPGNAAPRFETAQVPDARSAADTARVESFLREPFDLSAGTPLRALLLEDGKQAPLLVVVAHSMVADNHSIDRLFEALAEALHRGEVATEPVSYSAFLVAQQQVLDSEQGREALAETTREATDAPVLTPATDAPFPKEADYRGRRLSRRLAPALSDAVTQLAETLQVPRRLVFQNAWRLLLGRYARQHDFILGVETAPADADSRYLGPTAVLSISRVPLTAGDRFADLVRRDLGADSALAVPYEMLAGSLLEQSDTRRPPLFQAGFRYSQTRPRPEVLTRVSSALAIAAVDLALTVTADHNGDVVALVANRAVFADASLLAMLDALVVLLERLGDGDARRLFDLPLTKAMVTVPSLQGPAVPAADQDLFSAFAAQAAKTPDLTAVIAADERYSYATLHTDALAIAAALQARGIGEGGRVGLCLDHRYEAIASMLAIVALGAAYVPLDGAYPTERLHFLIADAGLAAVICSSDTTARFETVTTALPVIELAAAGAGETVTLPAVDSQRPAYLIYTSGSTGTPKGVVVPHRAVLNNLNWRQQTWRLTPEDRVMQQYSFSFDPSVWAVFWPLLTGAATVLMPLPKPFDAAALVRDMVARQITVYGAAPSLHRVLIEEPGLTDCHSLRCVLSGGETLTPELTRQFADRLGVDIVNLYGPTEATIDATCRLGQAVGEASQLSIGRALPNCDLLILDASLNAVPAGMAGEICIGGAQLAHGYAGRPALTADRFVPHPFSQTPGARLYRTGDLGRLRADGDLAFLGRVDDQVKVNGFRIELGEIEATLAGLPGVATAAVLAKQEAGGRARLVAWVEVPGGEPTQTAVAEALAQRLPAHMIPHEINLLPALPRTPGGKIDRPALGRRVTATPQRRYVAPRSGLEREVVEAFQKILSLDRVGMDDPFFEIGGDSLSATRLASRLSDTYNLQLNVGEILEEPTPAGVASRLAAFRKQGGMASALQWTPEALAQEGRLDPAVQMEGMPAAEVVQPDHVLVTGATGYLGAFLVDRLLDEPGQHVTCVVRAADDEAAWRRLEETLRMFLIWRPEKYDRLHVVKGDISKPRLGLEEATYARLAGEIGAIYHSAALVNFIYPYSVLRTPNVLGTEAVLALACTTRRKAVHYISTVDVLLGAKVARPFVEDHTALTDPVQTPEGYGLSKWVAEKLIRDADARGIPVTVFRPGLIMGHTQTGATQTNNYLFVGLKGYLELGILPEDKRYFDAVPVDFAAGAIAHISRQSTAMGKIFHLWHTEPVRTMALYDWLKTFGYQFDVVTRREARARVLEVDPDNALYPFVPHFKRTSVDDDAPSAFDPDAMADSDAQIECRNTLAFLAGSGLVCPPIDERYTHDCLRFLAELGFLPPVATPQTVSI